MCILSELTRGVVFKPSKHVGMWVGIMPDRLPVSQDLCDCLVRQWPEDYFCHQKILRNFATKISHSMIDLAHLNSPDKTESAAMCHPPVTHKEVPLAPP